VADLYVATNIFSQISLTIHRDTMSTRQLCNVHIMEALIFDQIDPIDIDLEKKTCVLTFSQHISRENIMA